MNEYNTYLSQSIPKGDNYYARAKRAHVVEKNLNKAEALYRKAIKVGDKMRSAIKDLSNVLHQVGRTEEACQILESNKHLFSKDNNKIDNLLQNLQKQIVPTGNFLNKTLVLFNLSSDFDENKIRGLFENSVRMDSIEFANEQTIKTILDGYEPIKDHYFPKPQIILPRACLIHFSSNSAARKTLDSLKEDGKYQFYWLNSNWKLVRKAEPFRKNFSEDTKSDTISSSGSVDSFEECAVNGNAGWSSFVYPVLEENGNACSTQEWFCQKNSRIDSLWSQVSLKLFESQSMILSDPQYVNRLLNKMIIEAI